MARNLALDLGKFVLATMVIALHSGFMVDYNPLVNYLTVQGLFRIAVPTFFLINGFYFYRFLQRRNANMTQWLQRALLLYGIWMLIYSPWWLFNKPLAEHSGRELITTVLLGYGHLWYLSAMVGAGLLTWLLRNHLPQASALAVLAFSCGIVIQYAANYQTLPDNQLGAVAQHITAHRNFLFLGFPFFFLGYLIHHQQWHRQLSSTTCTKLLVLGSGLLLTESAINYAMPQMQAGFDNYVSLLLICPPLLVYLLQSQHVISSRLLGETATAVYLSHPLWIDLLADLQLRDTALLFLATFALSVAFAIPLVKLNQRYLRVVL